ncbi:MAG: HD-GYP domain-containing protein [Planctomycetales bacterium]|nr:HD-GYP domain-containing protein [Planctomycetales bacterium]
MATDLLAISQQLATIDQLLSLPEMEILDKQSAAQSDRPANESLHVLRQIRSYADDLGMPLFCVDVNSGRILGRSHAECLEYLPRDLLQKLRESHTPLVWPQSSDFALLSIPLSQENNERLVAIGYVLSHPGAQPYDLVVAAANQNWSQAKLDDWLSGLPLCDVHTLKRLLHAVVRQGAHATAHESQQRDLHQLTSQIEYTYEEISLLHALTQNLQISKAPSELAWLALKRLHGVISAEGHAVWLDERRRPPQFLIQGRMPIGADGLLKLVSQFDQHDWSRPLVKNHVSESLLADDFPSLQNFVLVPIAEGSYRCGWLCCCNAANDEEFGTVQASLLASVGTILGTHTRNRDLYQQHEELLVCFVRSLVSSLDAKDRYTRGHSERVALVARRLGKQLNLPEEDLRQIYLSGLLHDIGKIGVDDQILRKPSNLTPDEFEQVKKHPMIGYEILVGLKNLQTVIPGVRHHHESWNGKGYPDGLKGEEIPLMARILAVADSYDAMGSDRPYRAGMPLDVLENIFRRGADSQWDTRVIDAYFAVRDEIRSICEAHAQEPSAQLTMPSAGTEWLPKSVMNQM